MMLFVAHHIRDVYMDKWNSDSVAVYPHFSAKLNGRNYQPYTNPEVNLSLEKWSWTKPYSFILPLDEDNFPEKYAPKNQDNSKK